MFKSNFFGRWRVLAWRDGDVGGSFLTTILGFPALLLQQTPRLENTGPPSEHGGGLTILGISSLPKGFSRSGSSYCSCLELLPGRSSSPLELHWKGPKADSFWDLGFDPEEATPGEAAELPSPTPQRSTWRGWQGGYVRNEKTKLSGAADASRSGGYHTLSSVFLADVRR